MKGAILLLYVRHCTVTGAVPPVSTDGPNRAPVRHSAAHRSVVLETPTVGPRTLPWSPHRAHKLDSSLNRTFFSIRNQLGQIVLYDVLRSFSWWVLHFPIGRTQADWRRDLSEIPKRKAGAAKFFFLHWEKKMMAIFIIPIICNCFCTQPHFHNCPNYGWFNILLESS